MLQDENYENFGLFNTEDERTIKAFSIDIRVHIAYSVLMDDQLIAKIIRVKNPELSRHDARVAVRIARDNMNKGYSVARSIRRAVNDTLFRLGKLPF